MWIFYKKHLAETRPATVTAMVWSGIWLKLGISASKSWLAHRKPTARTGT